MTKEIQYKIQSVVNKIETLGAVLISSDSFSPLPHDIDIYVKSEHKFGIENLLKDEGFVLTENKYGMTALKFFEGKCYYLDIIYDANYLAELFIKTQFTDRLFENVIQDTDIDKFFKYVFLLRTDDKSVSFVRENFSKYQTYLSNKTLIKNSPFKSNITADELVGVMQQKISSLTKALTWNGLIDLYYSKFCLRIKLLGKGQIIAVVGPDGSGKSTVIDALQTALFAKKMYMGDWGFCLQPLYNKMHDQHIIIARLTYPFFYIENWLRYTKAFYLKMTGATVLVDRWPGLNRHLRNDNIWLLFNDWLYFLFPKADRYLFISAPAELIHKRKQELSIEEIRRSQDNLRTRLQKTNHREINNVNIDDCLNEALTYILTQQG